jgi:hypothetical protein
VLRAPRRVTPPEELSIRDLIIRIRWERAKRDALVPGSAVYLTVGETEAGLLRELLIALGSRTSPRPISSGTCALITRRAAGSACSLRSAQAIRRVVD